MKRTVLAAMVAWALGTCVLAQTSTPIVDAQLTITAPLQNATIAVTPATLSVAAGQTASYTVAITGPAGTPAPTGTMTLEVSPHGQNAYQNVNSYTLTGNPVTCTYTAPDSLGVYDVHVVYSGDKNYNPRP